MGLKLKIALGILAVVTIGLVLTNPFRAPRANAEPERFVVPVGANYKDVVKKLAVEGFIRHPFAFNLFFGGKIAPGGYKISKAMSSREIGKILKQEPYMKWVAVPEGLRKEEVASLLAEELDWLQARKKEFIDAPAKFGWEVKDGVYFPETYLLPKDENGSDVAARMYTKFNEKFNPYSAEFVNENIKWTTAVKLASLIQREAAGEKDMKLISGILWNRLLKDMKLDIDATIQYAKGKEGEWWPKLKSGDTEFESRYNTYLHKGLPPEPIANPGLSSLLAVLHPAQTDCLFYLHDNDQEIHCAVTYEEHQANIERYLK